MCVCYRLISTTARSCYILSISEEQWCSERQEIKANRSEVVLFKRYDREKSEILQFLRHAILDESSQSRLYVKMNGHASTVYSMLSRVCDLFFPIVYDFVPSC